MPGINMMPSGSTLQIPLDACTNFSGKAGNAQIALTWTDPKDKYATPEGETAQDPDQLVSVWDHTVLVRKTGAQPAGPNDGTVVVSSSVRDQYASAGYVDTGLTNDVTYYYAVFAYNTDGVASEGAFTSATPIAGTPLSELAEGTLIKILENGAPVEFYLAKHNYEPDLNGQGRELVVRKDCCDEQPILAKVSSAPQANWSNGPLRNWLNSTYILQFSSSVKRVIGSTGYYYNTGKNAGNTASITDACFILSSAEYGTFPNDDMDSIDGERLPIYNVIRISRYNGSPTDHWTRTRNFSLASSNCIIDDKGRGTNSLDADSVLRGVRPCFTLPSTALVDQDLNLIETAVQTTALSAA